MTVLVADKEEALRALFVVSGASLLIFLSLMYFGLRRMLRGGRREARRVADPVTLAPGAATRSFRMELRPGLTGGEVFAALIAYLRTRNATLVREEKTAVVLFVGSRWEVFKRGFHQANQHPLRVLAHITRGGERSYLCVRFDSDFAPPLVGKFAFFEAYRRAFDRIAPDVEKELTPYRLETAAEGVEAAPVPAELARSLQASLPLTKSPPEPEVADAPEQIGLASVGRQLAEFSLSGLRRLALFVAGVATVVAVLLLLGLAAHPSISPPRWTWQMYAGMALLLFTVFPAGAALAFNAVRHRRLHVTVGEYGIEYVDGDAVKVCGWAQVQSVWEYHVSPGSGLNREVLRALARGEHRMVLVRCSDGQTLTFGSFIGGLNRLVGLIRGHTLPYLEPPARHRIEAGEEVRFGPLLLYLHGITGPDGHRIEWPEVARVEPRRGWLTVRKAGAWGDAISVPVTELPNVHVLLTLAGWLRKGAARGR